MLREHGAAEDISFVVAMERSGSGLGKIRDVQMYSAKYVPDRQPVFYSDRSQFVITIPNLNYENEKIKSFLAGNGREQDNEQVRVQENT